MTRPLRIAQDIMALGDFKTQASKVLRRLHDEHRPVVITQNGRPAAVVITPEEFDRMQDSSRFFASVRSGLEDAEAGRLIDDEELGTVLDQEFGTL